MDLNPCRAIVWLLAAVLSISAAVAGEPAKCAGEPPVLWGDGEHDDAAALNAWFRGETVSWAKTGDPVGPEVAGYSFLLGDTVFIPSGTDRKLRQFRMVWPHRHETVSGGAIATGTDPDQPPTTQGVVTVNSDPSEGVPFDAPDDHPGPTDSQATTGCLTS